MLVLSFVLFTVIVVVVAMNLLIAIMGEQLRSGEPGGARPGGDAGGNGVGREACLSGRQVFFSVSTRVDDGGGGR